MCIRDRDYVSYFLYQAAWVPFPFIMGFLITKICKPEMPIDGKAYFVERQKQLGAWTKDEKRTMIVLFLFITYLFTYRWHGMEMCIRDRSRTSWQMACMICSGSPQRSMRRQWGRSVGQREVRRK